LFFQQYGDIRTLYTACKHRGFVMISYYDLRAAQNAMKALQSRSLSSRKLDIRYSIPKVSSCLVTSHVCIILFPLLLFIWLKTVFMLFVLAFFSITAMCFACSIALYSYFSCYGYLYFSTWWHVREMLQRRILAMVHWWYLVLIHLFWKTN